MSKVFLAHLELFPHGGDRFAETTKLAFSICAHSGKETVPQSKSRQTMSSITHVGNDARYDRLLEIALEVGERSGLFYEEGPGSEVTPPAPETPTSVPARGRRPSEMDDPVERIARGVSEIQSLMTSIDRDVAEARGRGVPWRVIASALGVTKSAAIQRFGRARPPE